MLFTLALISGCVSGPAPVGELFEGFEETHYWIAVGNSWKDGDNSLAASTSDKNATQGKKSLECTFKFQSNNKGAAFYGEGFEKYDWAEAIKLHVDAVNPTGTELTIAFAVCTGDDWYWIESDAFPLPAGKNKDIIFDLTSQAYKHAATGWELTGRLNHMDDVKRLIFKINGPEGLEGSVYIDNIRLE